MRDVEYLLRAALDAGLGSAAALSIGDEGVMVERTLLGTTARAPEVGAPIGEDTRFDVASLTKPMVTAAIAMALVSEHRLDLDRPLRTWLPASRSDGTVAHLLGHAAGYPAHTKFYEQLRAGDRFGAPTARAALTQLATASELVARAGQAALYSDLGYIVLGALLERVADHPLEQLFHTYVVEPLGLAHATFVDVAKRPLVHLGNAVATEHDAARGHVNGVVHDENCHAGGGIAGHAGLFATLGDVERFAQAMVLAASGERVGRFDPGVVAQFLRTSAAPGSSWRLGWDTPSPTRGVSHAGDHWPRIGAVGHLGFTGTSMWLDLTRRRWVVLLTNRVHPRRDDTAEPIKQLRRAVMDGVVAMLDRHPR